ncbi:MAG: hypothetical protein GF401_16795 [Chitinivibrionales bacterium]|nr:hypothetical protein [Chitinivibrionales bacterium]
MTNLGLFSIAIPPEPGLSIVSISNSDVLRLELDILESGNKIGGIQIKFYPESKDLHLREGILNDVATVQMVTSNAKPIEIANIFSDLEKMNSNNLMPSNTISFKKYSASPEEMRNTEFVETLAASVAINIILTPLTGSIVAPNTSYFYGANKDKFHSKWHGYVVSNFQLVNNTNVKGIINAILQTYTASDKLLYIMDYIIHSIRIEGNFEVSVDSYILYDNKGCDIILKTGKRAKGYIDEINEKHIVYRKSSFSKHQINLKKRFVKMTVCGEDTSWISE